MNRVNELEKLIQHHKALYYQGRPEISDHEYDKLEDELRKIDPGNGVLDIVGSINENPDKVPHDKKMLSLDKTYSIDDLKKWIGTETAISMFKIDGVSCSLIYEGGHLSLAKTRGDGKFGEDITAKILWNKTIPKSISTEGKVEVRGELYCDEKSFFSLSEEMESLGLEKPSSQRNIVAGLVGRKDNIELCRHISFQGFDVLTEELDFKTESKKFSYLAKEGFETPKITTHSHHKNVESSVREAEEFMSEGDYQIDGLVFSFDNTDLHDELGETAHHPRYKMAFKFAGEAKTTTLNEILWSVSRNGILTPVGIVEPVELSGALISRVTLHNYGMVKQHGLKKGDVIEIIRSGEVIPKFLGVIKSSKSKFSIPKNCPSCEEEIEVVDIRIYCRNDSCPGKNKESILNFIQKIGIETISKKRLDEMIKDGLVTDVPSLYRLERNEFLNLEKVKEKLADKFYSEIQKSKKTTLPVFLAALGISGGAINKCEKIVENGFDTIEKVLKMSVDDLVEIESFAEKSATEFVKSLSSKKLMVKELLELGFEFKNEKNSSSATLSGKSFCITGTLTMKRSVIEKMIKEAGGSVTGSVSKNTSYLVTNDKESSSSKFKKAKQLGTEILDEEALQKLIQS